VLVKLKIWWIPCFGILHYLIWKGAMRGSRRMVEATSFRRRRMAGSFLREAMGSCLRKPLQINLYHLVLRKYLFFALNLIKYRIFPLDSQNTGNTVRIIEDAPRKAISEVQASTSLVSSGSVLPREKVELAYKLLGVSSRTLRVVEYRSSSVLIFLFSQEVLGQEGGQTQDDTELNVLKERVKTLSSEKAALHEKLKKLSKAKKG
jgi:hypothetical protein